MRQYESNQPYVPLHASYPPPVGTAVPDDAYGTVTVRYVPNVRRIVGTVAAVLSLGLAFGIPGRNALAIDPASKGIDLPVADAVVPANVASASNGDFDWSAAGSSSYARNPESWDWLCYDQGAEPWAWKPYQTDSIAQTGCGLCSAAHCLTMVLDEEIKPDELAERMREYSDAHGYIDFGSNGTVWAGWEEVLQGLYGDRVDIQKEPTTPEAVKDAVTHGRAVVFNAPSGGDVLNADGVWGITPYGHVLTCYRYENGAFYVKDSSSQQSGHGLGNAIRYTDSEFAMMMEQASHHLGWVYTFEAKGSMGD